MIKFTWIPKRMLPDQITNSLDTALVILRRQLVEKVSEKHFFGVIEIVGFCRIAVKGVPLGK
jgi:hypothetical protein